ncbi:hypothetical protein GcC1_208038 [Golovinomyces cichoracearum]|uniref:Uncharacterized protein n=1 Tax=Golovinomyces cichoracearum TaxID=62708 RepID=A0A420HBT6_9PEZI|nr:hypothetical protein GcC1_208038 [Golovinomyces cichoracearum]
MLCFTLLTRILGCPRSIGCRPGAYIYHNDEDTQIGRIYGEDMMRITEDLQAEASHSIPDVSKDRLTKAVMYCTWGPGLENSQILMEKLLKTAERNSQEHIESIYSMTQSIAKSSKTSIVRLLHKRRAFKALPGKYNCVSLLNRASLEVPPLKTNLPTRFTKLSSEQDFVIMSYRANFVMITLIGISDLKILHRNLISPNAYPSKESITPLKLVFHILRNYKTLQKAFVILKVRKNRGEYLTGTSLKDIVPQTFGKIYYPLTVISKTPFLVGGEDHSLIGLLTDVVLSMLEESWEFLRIRCNYLPRLQRLL